MAEHNNGNSRATLYVVGTGTGSVKHMTYAASETLQESDIIVGYKTYLDLIPEFLKGSNLVIGALGRLP